MSDQPKEPISIVGRLSERRSMSPAPPPGGFQDGVEVAAGAVVDIETRRPHTVSSDQCGACGHTWVGVAVAGAARWGIECPSCGARAGVVRFFYAVGDCPDASAPAVLDGLGRPQYEW